MDSEIVSIEIEGEQIEITYADGSSEEIENGVYEHEGPDGVTLEKRPATPDDVARFDSIVAGADPSFIHSEYEDGDDDSEDDSPDDSEDEGDDATSDDPEDDGSDDSSSDESSSGDSEDDNGEDDGSMHDSADHAFDDSQDDGGEDDASSDDDPVTGDGSTDDSDSDSSDDTGDDSSEDDDSQDDGSTDDSATGDDTSDDSMDDGTDDSGSDDTSDDSMDDGSSGDDSSTDDGSTDDTTDDSASDDGTMDDSASGDDTGSDDTGSDDTGSDDGPDPAALALAQDVSLLYTEALGRVPDTDGLNFWIDAAEGGMSLKDLAGAFIDSLEFKETVGDAETLSDDDFVAACYEHILGREGDDEGEAFWSGALAAGHSRAEMVRDFAISDENRATEDTLDLLHETSPGEWDLGA